jgi:hypothetical protein
MFDDYSEIKNTYRLNIEKAKNNLEYAESKEYSDKCLQEIREELYRRSQEIGTIEDRVEAFAKTNYLLSYPFDEKTAEACDIPSASIQEKGNDEYLKQELEQDEFLDIEDTDIKVTLKKLSKIKDFFNSNELKTVKANTNEYRLNINTLYETITKIPSLRSTDEIDISEKIAYLHYFYGGTDFYILELGTGDIFDDDQKIQQEAFGWAIVNGDYINAELGYISIDEIKQKCELDLYFKPVKLGIVIDSFDTSVIQKQKESETEKQEYLDAIEGLSTMLDYVKGKEKKEYLDAIEGLKTMLELMD